MRDASFRSDKRVGRPSSPAPDRARTTVEGPGLVGVGLGELGLLASSCRLSFNFGKPPLWFSGEFSSRIGDLDSSEQDLLSKETSISLGACPNFFGYQLTLQAWALHGNRAAFVVDQARKWCRRIRRLRGPLAGLQRFPSPTVFATAGRAAGRLSTAVLALALECRLMAEGRSLQRA